MKSFKQFLSEEEARQGKLLTNKGTAQNFKNPKKIPFIGTDPTPTSSSSGSSEAPKAPKVSPGQMEIPSGKSPTGTTTKVPGSKVRGAAADPWKQFPKKPQQQLGIPKTGPSSTLPGKILAPAGGTSPRPALPATGQTQRGDALAKRPTSTPSAPVGTPSNPERIYPTPVKNSTSTGQKALPAAGQTSASKSFSSARQKALPAAGQTSASKPEAASTTGKPPSGPKLKVPSGVRKALRIGGKVLGPAAAALDVADEKSKGSGWARSLAKGAAVAAGGSLGGAVGSVGGPVGSIAGATGGSMAASKAFDVAAGANAKERKAMATANRQRQAGSAIKGIGGKTTFDTKKNTMTTGTGSQRKTVQLAKTGVVQRGGQSTAGYLAYKGGKAVYKAGPSAQSLAKTSSNPLERIGRSLFAGAYKQSDAANAAKKLAKAKQSDVARNKALGVKMLPGK